VGLFDIIRGQRTPKRADLDRIFAMGTALTTLELNLDLHPTGRAGVCFKPVEGAPFEDMERDLTQLLEISGRSTGTEVERQDDRYGFTWIVLADDDFDDLVTTTHLVNTSLEERGFSEQLLCSVFGFRQGAGDRRLVEFVYAYKRGAFYPFVPTGERERDNALELRLKAALERELPIERELERWYPVYGAPVDDA
jgi:hypothetical protein